MEGLRKQGLSALSRVHFVPAPDEHELITIADPTNPHPERVYLPLHDILDRFQNLSTTLPALRLVKLHIHHPPVGKTSEPPVLNAIKDDIIRLWEQFNLDTSLFQLVAKGIRGFYQHHTTTPILPHRSDQYADLSYSPKPLSHFVICSYIYCIAWTYSPQTQTTSAVMILRPEAHLGRVDFEEWFEALGMQISLARHHLCLLLTTMMHTMQLASAGAQGSQALINDVEYRTGFYPWTPKSRQRFLSRTTPGDEDDGSSLEGRGLMPRNSSACSMTLDELSLASRNIGAVLVFLEDHFRQIRQLEHAIEAFTNGGKTDCQDNVILQDQHESVTPALRLLQQQMDSSNIRLNYLRERGKNQLTVIFNLMTRADAQASINLAKSAKKDSSSMKVIAIMTMAFLPSTFFAALFAVPSLKWDASPVMQDNFWVFWALAIPSTTLVFMLWFLLSPRDDSQNDASTISSLWSWRSILRGTRLNDSGMKEGEGNMRNHVGHTITGIGTGTREDLSYPQEIFGLQDLPRSESRFAIPGTDFSERLRAIYSTGHSEDRHSQGMVW